MEAVANVGPGAGVGCTASAAESVTAGGVEAGSVGAGVVSGKGVVIGGSAVAIEFAVLVPVAITFSNTLYGIEAGGGIDQGE